MKVKNDSLPFEKYVHSESEKEYKLDKRKKAYILKYANLLENNNLDSVSLKRFCDNMLIFRNLFCKETMITFFMTEFTEESKGLLGCIIFDMCVASQRGVICEMKEFQVASCDLYRHVDRHSAINKKWTEIKKSMADIL